MGYEKYPMVWGTFSAFGNAMGKNVQHHGFTLLEMIFILVIMAGCMAFFVSQRPMKQELRDVERLRHSLSEAVFISRRKAFKNDRNILLAVSVLDQNFVITGDGKRITVPFQTKTNVENPRFSVGGQTITFTGKFHKPFDLNFSLNGQPKKLKVDEYAQVKKG